MWQCLENNETFIKNQSTTNEANSMYVHDYKTLNIIPLKIIPVMQSKCLEKTWINPKTSVKNITILQNYRWSFSCLIEIKVLNFLKTFKFLFLQCRKKIMHNTKNFI